MIYLKHNTINHKRNIDLKKIQFLFTIHISYLLSFVNPVYNLPA